MGGKFMERTRVLRPGSSLFDSTGPLYYSLTDLWVGARIEVLRHRFVLIDADETVFNYMESEGRFAMSDRAGVFAKGVAALQGSKEGLRDGFAKADVKGTGSLERGAFVEVVSKFVHGFNDHEIITFARNFESEASVRKPDYVRLLSLL